MLILTVQLGSDSSSGLQNPHCRTEEGWLQHGLGQLLYHTTKSHQHSQWINQGLAKCLFTLQAAALAAMEVLWAYNENGAGCIIAKSRE